MIHKFRLQRRGVGELLLTVALGSILCGCGKKEEYVYPISKVAETEETVQEKSDGADICVYVCGAVQSPGVYALPGESRIADAVKLAGGMTKDACPDSYNLAEHLADGQMIRIPTMEEAGDNADVSADKDRQQTDSKEAGSRININTASKEELMAIPGIGATRAQNILDYRQENGFFSSPEDIMKVTGIKNGLYDKMKAYICAE